MAETYTGDARHLTEVALKKCKVVYSSHLLEDFWQTKLF